MMSFFSSSRRGLGGRKCLEKTSQTKLLETLVELRYLFHDFGDTDFRCMKTYQISFAYTTHFTP